MSVLQGNRLVLGLSAIAMLSSFSLFAQSPECINRIPVVQANGTVNIDLSAYMGTGVGNDLATNPGHLDTCDWRVESLNTAGTKVTVDFGQTSAERFFGHGEMTAEKVATMNPSGGLYSYKPDITNNRTVIWVRPRGNIFSPGSLTARLNITGNPMAALALNQRWYFLRRNNSAVQEVSMNAKYHAGSAFNESLLQPLYSFNTSIITAQSQVQNRCFRVTVPSDLLTSGPQVFIQYVINDLDESGGVRDDVALDFSPTLQGSDRCEQIDLGPTDMTSSSAMSSPEPTGTPSISVETSEEPMATGSAQMVKAGIALALSFVTLYMTQLGF